MSSASKVRGYTLLGVVGGAAFGLMLILPAQSEDVVLADAPVNSVPASPVAAASDSGVDWQPVARDELAAGTSIANYDRW